MTAITGDRTIKTGENRNCGTLKIDSYHEKICKTRRGYISLILWALRTPQNKGSDRLLRDASVGITISLTGGQISTSLRAKIVDRADKTFPFGQESISLLHSSSCKQPNLSKSFSLFVSSNSPRAQHTKRHMSSKLLTSPRLIRTTPAISAPPINM